MPDVTRLDTLRARRPLIHCISNLVTANDCANLLLAAGASPIMAQALPEQGIACRIIPRLEQGGKAISASTVRAALKDGDWETLKTLVPEATYAYFRSPAAKPVLEAIRKAENVVHY